MKIIYISDSLIPSQSANSIHVMKMCNALVELGYDTTLIGLKNQNENIDIHKYYGVSDKIKLNLINQSKVRYISNIIYGRSTKKIVKSHKPDLIIGRSLAGFYFCSEIGIPYIFESHEPVLNDEHKLNGNLFKELMIKKILKSKNIQAFILISEELKKLYDLREYSKINLIVAHDGADSYDLNAKADLKGNNENLKIGYIGKFYRGRGIDIILKSAEFLPQFEFHLLGGSNDDLKKIFPNAEIPKNIFTYNFINPSVVYKYRNSMDILLAPYQNDTNISAGINTTTYMSPLKIFEYMSSAKPIIASDFKVLREVLNAENSILVKPDDIDGWKNAILTLQNKEIRDNLAAKALEDFNKKYTWKARVLNILSKVNI